VPRIVDTHRDGRLDGRQSPPLGQEDPEVLFATLARDGQFHLLTPPQGDAVLENREQFHAHKIPLRCLGRGVAPQPEQPLGIPSGVLDGLAIAAQRQDSQRGRDPEVLRRLVPEVAPFEAGVARRNLHRWRPVAFHHHHRSSADLDFLGPDLGASGQRNPGVMEGGDHHREPPAGRGHLKLQSRRPEAPVDLGVGIGCRAEPVGVVPRGPGFPGLERSRDGARLLGSCRPARGDQRRQEQQQERDPEPER